MQEDIKKINKGILLTILILGCFLSTLNQTLLNVALSNLMDVFDVTAPPYNGFQRDLCWLTGY